MERRISCSVFQQQQQQQLHAFKPTVLQYTIMATPFASRMVGFIEPSLMEGALSKNIDVFLA
jgi:hypothetical protein